MEPNQNSQEDYHRLNAWGSNPPQWATREQSLYSGGISVHNPAVQSQGQPFVNFNAPQYHEHQFSFAAHGTQQAMPWQLYCNPQDQQYTSMWSSPYQPVGCNGTPHSSQGIVYHQMSPFQPPQQQFQARLGSQDPQAQYHDHQFHDHRYHSHQIQPYQQHTFVGVGAGEQGTLQQAVCPYTRYLVAQVPGSGQMMWPSSTSTSSSSFEASASSRQLPGAGQGSPAICTNQQILSGCGPEATWSNGGAGGLSASSSIGTTPHPAKWGDRPAHVGPTKDTFTPTMSFADVSTPRGKAGGGRITKSSGSNQSISSARRCGESKLSGPDECHPRRKSVRRSDAAQKPAPKARIKPNRKPPRPTVVSRPATAQCISALGFMAMSGFSKVRDLELTCVDLSNACREGAPWCVKINRHKMPVLLNQFWRAPVKSKGFKKRARKQAASRLIERRIVKHLVIIGNCNPADVIWPVAVEKVHFWGFNRAMEHVEWPEKVSEISLFSDFDHPIEQTNWPSSLRVLQLSPAFNQPIEEIKLPESVERVLFGEEFNQSIAGVKWPSNLQELQFGSMFNESLNGVTWPEALKELKFVGPRFNQPIHDTPLPRDLEILQLGDGFDQPLDDVVWPAGLRVIYLGESFMYDLEGVEWPKSLESITAPDIPLGTLPPNCVVIELADYQDHMEEEMASIMSHLMMAGGFLHPFDAFEAIEELDHFDDGFVF